MKNTRISTGANALRSTTATLGLTVLFACASSSTEVVDDAGVSMEDAGISDVGASDQGVDVIEQSTVDPARFLQGGLASPDIEIVDCTLSGGAQTRCYRVTTVGAPSDHEVGPFCPRNISDGAEAGGLWIENGQTYELSGAFIADLATFYNDPAWQLFDPQTGDINVTETQEACEAAARPNVDPQYQNHCVECELSYVGGGVSRTYLLPVEPVPLSQPAEIDRRNVLGVALNGIDFDPPAPVDAILGAYTIAAFDDCGGHINPFAGYHYHAATGCQTEVPSSDGHAPLIGYTMDGYGLHAMRNSDGAEPTDLDVCRGHSDSVRGYHYHAASAGENMFIGCFHGEQGSVQ